MKRKRITGLCLLAALLSWGCAEAETKRDDTSTTTRRKKKRKKGKETTKVSDAQRVVSIAHGERHACTLFADGHVECWGRNDVQQLGMPGKDHRLTPAPALGVMGASKITAAGTYTCVVDAARDVLCWGDVPERGKSTPMVVPGLRGAVSIAAADDHFCAALTSGEVKCFGSNRYGELGTGSKGGAAMAPVEVTGVAGAVEVGVGNEHSCARTADGKVMCWGGNDDGQVGDGTKVATPTPKTVPLAQPALQLAAGEDNSCVVVADSTVQCWGESLFDMLGGREEGTKPQPIALTAKVTAVAIGDDFACARTQAGGVHCWGRDGDGRLGRFTEGDDLPGPVEGLADVDAIALGDAIGCAIVDGAAKCWGSAAHGRLGDGSTTTYPVPVTVPKIADAKGIAVGDGYSCALRSTGAVACWGDGTVDTGEMSKRYAPRARIPVDVAKLTNVDRIHGLDSHLLAHTVDGTMLGSRAGLLRDPGGYFKDEFTPTARPSLHALQTIGLGGYRGSFGVLVDGSVAAIHIDDQQAKVARVTGIPRAVHADMAYDTVCIVQKSGAVGCFEHKLTSSSDFPTSLAATLTPVAGVTDATQVTVGISNGCALGRGGEVWCWDLYTKPHQAEVVPGVSQARQLVDSANGSVQCALLDDGGVSCWSDGAHDGQLGNGTFSESMTPKPVTGLDDAVQLAASDSHVCAVRKTGHVACWGSNVNDQLGAPAPPVAWSPVDVRIATVEE